MNSGSATYELGDPANSPLSLSCLVYKMGALLPKSPALSPVCVTWDFARRGQGKASQAGGSVGRSWEVGEVGRLAHGSPLMGDILAGAEDV